MSSKTTAVVLVRCVTLAACLSGVRAASILTDDPPNAVASLGVRTQSLAPPASPAADLPPIGVRVATVDPTGPSATALQPNDILQQVNEQLLFTPIQLAALLQSLSPGETAAVVRVRGDATQTVAVTLGRAAPDESAENSDAALMSPDPGWDSGASTAPGALDGVPITNLMQHLQVAFEEVRPHDRLNASDDAPYMEALRRQLEDVYLSPPTTNADDYRVRQYAVYTPNDERNPVTQRSADGSLTVTEQEGQRIYTFQNDAGEIMYEGAVQSREDLDKMPASVWKQFYKLERDRREAQAHAEEP
ncbi:MAG: PDZ domain-containing protein [Lentisphaerae bacterium]|nr:PDZ domain-containing protein [Lentisphaerota bacterium]